MLSAICWGLPCGAAADAGEAAAGLSGLPGRGRLGRGRRLGRRGRLGRGLGLSCLRGPGAARPAAATWACTAAAWMARSWCDVSACTVCGATELALACDPANAAASARLPGEADEPGQAVVVPATTPATASAEPAPISVALVCLRGLR